ncbi:GNAT family N-acetyltransferase [Candidatus Thiodiazotropha sp. CDECU1]|uniref:GNAT family N-acetyltransferase n=1 Tax=Candidatus Thiodiazotropha sp. CDECU1 TaxID=3065865 RepID=UPI00292F47A5|nr:GNAT family N-acetyltransferase [Candidatus Thiodiazotropha sp. CDECU1]
MDLVSSHHIEKNDWPTSASELQSPTYAHEWFSACIKAFRDDIAINFLATTKHDHVNAIAPLYAITKKGIIWYEIIGVSKLNEPGGLIYADKESLIQLCKSIIKKGRPTHLGRLPAGDLSIEVFEKLAAKHGIIFKIPNTGSPFIEINSNWDDYLLKLPSRRKQDFRRARRRLSDQGEVYVDFYYPDQTDLNRLLDKAFGIEQANWKGRNNSAINCRPDLKRFFTIYCRYLSQTRKLVISALLLNGAMIAVQLMVQHSNRWWVLKIGYDERWAKYSPGIQLMFETIKEAFNRKLDAFELLGTEEQWINIWPHKTHQFTSIVYFPFNLRGVGALIEEAGSKYLSPLMSNPFIKKNPV